VARAAAGRLRAGGRRAEVVVLLRQRLPVGDQAGLTSGERAANLRDSLAVRADALRALGRRRRPVTAVVCDDVLTTGATARESQRALEDVGLPVAAVCCVAATRKRVPAAPAPLPFWPHSD
jgi:predicted amidophosphoribosyltransferase